MMYETSTFSSREIDMNPLRVLEKRKAMPSSLCNSSLSYNSPDSESFSNKHHGTVHPEILFTLSDPQNIKVIMRKKYITIMWE